MKILALDSSATSASVAILDDEKIVGEFNINTRLTHSQTLMPMLKSLLECTNTSLDDIDRFAVCVGPGSFTGIRIGVSAVKGMCMGLDKPCIPVSTLESMPYNLISLDCIVCAVMDARCNQVYNAMFDVSGGIVKRLTPDRAIMIEELKKELCKYNKKIILVGDGANLCYNNMRESLNIEIAPEHLKYQNAVSVAQAAKNSDSVLSAKEIMPEYLRLPQAERELKKRQSLVEGVK